MATTTWVINAYNLAFAVLLVPMGRMADQFGRRRLFVAGMVVFTVASALCAAAPTIELLIAARAIQGAGAGMLAPLGFALAVLVFPPPRRGLRADADRRRRAGGQRLGPAAGRRADRAGRLAGDLPRQRPGRGSSTIVLARRWWPETVDPRAAGQKVDWLGMVLLAGRGVRAGADAQPGQPPGLGVAERPVAGAADRPARASGFWASQRFGAAPMVPRDLAANGRFRAANLAMLLFGAGFIGALLMLSLVFVDLWGYSPIEAGLALTPVPLSGLLTWPIAARTAGKVPARDVAVPALAAVAAGLLWLSALPAVADGPGDYLLLLPGLLAVGRRDGRRLPRHQRRRDELGGRRPVRASPRAC